MPVVLRVLLSFILAALLSIVFTWYMFYQQFGADTDETMHFIEWRTQVFWYSYVFILLLCLILMALFWRTFFGIGLTFAIISAMTYANEQKLKVRAAPIVPEDLEMAGQAGNLMQFVDAGEIWRLATGIVLLLIGTWLLDHYCKKVLGKDARGMRWWEKWDLVPRATFTLGIFASFLVLFNPLLHHDGNTFEYLEWLDGAMHAWNPTATYENNGLALTMLYNAGSSNLDEPEGYSKERIAEIYEKYKEKKTTQDKNRQNLAEVAENVVVILDESFYDPEILGETYAHSGGDVVPNLHKVFRKYPSGYMYSPEYGGGTANVEYAVHTGLSNYWAQTIAYTNFVTKLDYMPGIVSYVGKNGFGADAIHAFDGTMYKRNIVYDKMGYNKFYDESKMKHKTLENGVGYINDQSVYNEIYDLLAESDEPKFIGAATMQNHAPYGSSQYPEFHFRLKQPLENRSWVEAVFELLHNADRYLGEFLEKLDKFDEKTVVVWYGDHAAGVLDDYANSEDLAERDLVHLTPYFIYANFEIESNYLEEEVEKLNQAAGVAIDAPGTDLPTVTPNCIANLMYNILDVKKPVVSYLLDTVCEEMPILAPSYAKADNVRTNPTEALKEYELINYDISHGKRYWLELETE